MGVGDILRPNLRKGNVVCLYHEEMDVQPNYRQTKLYVYALLLYMYRKGSRCICSDPLSYRLMK